MSMSMSSECMLEDKRYGLIVVEPVLTTSHCKAGSPLTIKKPSVKWKQVYVSSDEFFALSILLKRKE